MIKDHIKTYTSLTTACLLWTASTIVKPVYISSGFLLRAIGKANLKQMAKDDPQYDPRHGDLSWTYEPEHSEHEESKKNPNHATSFSEVLEHYSK